MCMGGDDNGGDNERGNVNEPFALFGLGDMLPSPKRGPPSSGFDGSWLADAMLI